MSRRPFTVALMSHPGRVRRKNEDACAADADHGIVVVCDGVGGAAGGEIASRLASEMTVASVCGSASQPDASPDRRLAASVHFANAHIYQSSLQTPALHGMATTLVALLAEAGGLWVANVGDSRCYRLRANIFEQITHDHSVVEEQVRAGEITRAQAAVSPIRHVITRAVGSHPEIEVDLYELEPKPGDLYLLTTDGLMRELADAEIASVLAGVNQACLQAACTRLVDLAVENGGGDNITCALVYLA